MKRSPIPHQRMRLTAQPAMRGITTPVNTVEHFQTTRTVAVRDATVSVPVAGNVWHVSHHSDE